jgi:hypothetical protein
MEPERRALRIKARAIQRAGELLEQINAKGATSTRKRMAPAPMPSSRDARPQPTRECRSDSKRQRYAEISRRTASSRRIIALSTCIGSPADHRRSNCCSKAFTNAVERRITRSFSCRFSPPGGRTRNSMAAGRGLGRRPDPVIHRKAPARSCALMHAGGR